MQLQTERQKCWILASEKLPQKDAELIVPERGVRYVQAYFWLLPALPIALVSKIVYLSL
jgi:hypothetical protein